MQSYHHQYTSSSSTSTNPLSAFCLAMNSSKFPSTDSDINQACGIQQQQQHFIRSSSLASSDLTLSRGNSNTEIGYLPTTATDQKQQSRGASTATTSSNKRNVTAPATSAYPSLKSISPCSSSGSFTTAAASSSSPQAAPLVQHQQYVTVQLPNQDAGTHLVLQKPKPQLLIPGVAPLLATPLVVAPPTAIAGGSSSSGVSLPPPPTYGATVGPCLPTPPGQQQGSVATAGGSTSAGGSGINYGELWRNKHGKKKNKA